jgi:RNA polymerase II subunit A-like phosphatase
LNELRSKVKQKDDEFRRYTAKVERMKQLQLAKTSTAVVESNEEAHKKKSLSFDVVSDFSSTDQQAVAETESVEPSRCQMQTTSNGDERNSVQKQRPAYATSTPPSRKTESGNGEVELIRNKKVAEKERLIDPSKDRDRLRQKLEEAEELELQAIELRRKLFGSRIVSRTDVGDLGKDVKSLTRIFPCGGVLVRHLNYWPFLFLVKY